MIIRFEGTPVCNSQLTGIGTLEKKICEAMIAANPEDKFVFTYFSGMRNISHKKSIMRQFLSSNVRLKRCPLMSAGLYRLIWGFIPLPFRFFFSGKSDVTHFFNFLIPPGVKGKKVVTIHDLGFVRYPETVALRTRKMLELHLGKTIKRADHIFVDSDFTGRELTEIYGVSPDKMTTVYCGVDRELFKPMEYSECKEALEKRSLTDRGYFFYLGTLEPRKNIENLIISYAMTVRRLEAEGEKVPPLVLGGRLGWYYDQMLQRIKTEGIEDKIILAGYLDDSEKAALYARARAFVFPSLYEGFGIPVLEAMACATPVLTSDVSSLPEVVGDKAVLCNPHDTEEIANGLYRLATDDLLCEKLSMEGYNRSHMFSWDESARITREVYEKLLNGANATK